jgi:hypothetical protein
MIAAVECIKSRLPSGRGCHSCLAPASGVEASDADGDDVAQEGSEGLRP